MKNEITFEDIQKANDSIKTTDIKGKEYAEVNQRIKAYRMVYPQGMIHTEMVSNMNGICIFRANVSDNEKNIIATGTAYEKENSTFINKTSYIENCETSAVGRALGIAGFGIDTSVASAEEVQNAMANQEGTDDTKKKEIKATPSQLGFLKEFYTGEKLSKLLEVNGIEKIEDLSVQKASELIKKIKEKGEEK